MIAKLMLISARMCRDRRLLLPEHEESLSQWLMGMGPECSFEAREEEGVLDVIVHDRMFQPTPDYEHFLSTAALSSRFESVDTLWRLGLME